MPLEQAPLRPPAEPMVGPDGRATTAWIAFLQALAERLAEVERTYVRIT